MIDWIEGVDWKYPDLSLRCDEDISEIKDLLVKFMDMLWDFKNETIIELDKNFSTSKIAEHWDKFSREVIDVLWTNKLDITIYRAEKEKFKKELYEKYLPQKCSEIIHNMIMKYPISWTLDSYDWYPISGYLCQELYDTQSLEWQKIRRYLNIIIEYNLQIELNRQLEKHWLLLIQKWNVERNSVFDFEMRVGMTLVYADPNKQNHCLKDYVKNYLYCLVDNK